MLHWTYRFRVDTALFSNMHRCVINRLYAISPNLLCPFSSIQSIVCVFKLTLSFPWWIAGPSTGSSMSVKSLSLLEFVHPVKMISIVHVFMLIVTIVISVTSRRLYTGYNLKHFSSIAHSVYRRGGGVPPDINPPYGRIVWTLGATVGFSCSTCRLLFTPFMSAALWSAPIPTTDSLSLRHD